MVCSFYFDPILSICIFFVWFSMVMAFHLGSNYDITNLRNKYKKKLKKYYKNNKPRTYLINECCEACLMINEENIPAYFYVKERGFNQAGRYFEVKTDMNHVSTMWAYFDLEFNDFSTYDSLKTLYESLNEGSMFLQESSYKKLPNPFWGQKIQVQNEFCRMELRTFSNNESVILCSEIWGTPDYTKPKKFIIRADKKSLIDILHKFHTEYQMFDYQKLLNIYTALSIPNEFDVYELNIVQNVQQTNLSEENFEQTEIENILENYNERNIDL